MGRMTNADQASRHTVAQRYLPEIVSADTGIGSDEDD